MNYPIVIYPSDEGGYVAEVPALKGCLAQGETLPEALEELKIVKRLWIEPAEKNGQTLPDIEVAIQKLKTLGYNDFLKETPKGVLELKQLLRKMGFQEQSGEGMHTVWAHPLYADRIMLSSRDDADV